MAQPNAPIASRAERALGLTPSPAVQHGVRLGVAASLALWLSYAAGFPQPTWPVITALVVAQPTPGGSAQKSVLRLIGTAASGVASIVVYGAFAQEPLTLVACVAGMFAIATYGSSGGPSGYAWNVFGFTSGIILGDALSGSNQIEILAFDRVTLVGIGILASTLVEVLLWPRRPEARLRELLLARFDEVALRAREAAVAWSTGEHSSHVAERRADPGAPPPLAEQLDLLERMRLQLGVGTRELRAYGRIAFALQDLETEMRDLLERAARHGQAADDERAAPTLARLLDVIAETLDAGRAAFAAARTPSTSEPALDAAWRAFDEATRADAGAGEGRAPSARALAAAAAVASLADRARARGADLEKALGVLAHGEASPDAVGRAEALPRRAPLRVDPFRLEAALRAGLAVASVTVVMPLMGWEASAMPMTLAYMVAGVPTRAALQGTVVGLGLAVAASWLVSDLAIVYLVPDVGRMPAALSLSFALAFGAGWLAVARAKLAPVAPIIALIAILSIFGGERPPSDVLGPYLTVWTFTVGIAIGVVAQWLLWPRTAAELLRARISEQVSETRALLHAVSEAKSGAGRDALRARAMGSHAQQIVLVGQLHAQAEAEPEAPGLDTDRRAELIAAWQSAFEAALRVDDFGRSVSARDDAGPETTPIQREIARLDAAIDRSLAHTAAAIAAEPSAVSDTALEPAIDALRSAVEAERAAGLDATAGLGRLVRMVDARARLARCASTLEAWVAAEPGHRDRAGPIAGGARGAAIDPDPPTRTSGATT